MRRKKNLNNLSSLFKYDVSILIIFIRDVLNLQSNDDSNMLKVLRFLLEEWEGNRRRAYPGRDIICLGKTERDGDDGDRFDSLSEYLYQNIRCCMAATFHLAASEGDFDEVKRLCEVGEEYTYYWYYYYKDHDPHCPFNRDECYTDFLRAGIDCTALMNTVALRLSMPRLSDTNQ